MNGRVTPRGGASLGSPGRTALEIGAGPPPTGSAVPDHAVSECWTDSFDFRAASCRGLQHRANGTPRQDAFTIERSPSSDGVVVVVCDGVGSLERSAEAAAFVCGRLPALYWETSDWPVAISAVSAELAEIAYVNEVLVMATTVVAAAFTEEAVHVAWTDDSTCWYLDGGWRPAHDLPSDEDGAVATSKVVAIPVANPECAQRTLSANHPVFLMTDGVGEPLRLSEEVADQLASWWESPPDAFTFARQVAFARRTFIDDRTVVGAWPRSELLGG